VWRGGSLNLKAHNLQFFYKIRKILRNLQKKKNFEENARYSVSY